MFLKTQLSWHVSVHPSNLDQEGKALQKAIAVQLLDDFAAKKATRDIGYFMAVTTIDRVGPGMSGRRPDLGGGHLLFPVDFTCVSFKMLVGEVLDGIVHRVMKHGIFLRCGPAEKVYLSQRKMTGFKFVAGERPFFEEGTSRRVEKGTKVRFSVIAVRFDEVEKDFKAVVSLDGEGLGPIS